VLGFFGLALWQVVEAIGGSFGEGMDAWAGRGKAVAKAVVYLVLGWTTLSFARGKQSSSKQQTVDFTASMLQSTAGRVLVVVIGLVIIGVGVYHVYKGATKRFLRDLTENPGTFATRAGQIGYIAKGVALAIVGLLFVVAGVTRRARTAGGLDTALHTLREQPMGPALLTLVAIGLVAYGVYSFARARYARV
jgi:hypothetical protein